LDCQIQAETSQNSLQIAGFGNPVERKNSILGFSDKLLEHAELLNREETTPKEWGQASAKGDCLREGL